MAYSTTVGALIEQHPVNPVHDTDYSSGSNKKWTAEHPPIDRLILHVTINNYGGVQGTFDGPLEVPNADDDIRLAATAYPPNTRYWRMSSESDAANWFHHEVSNVVLPAFQSYPTVIQAAEAPPLREDRITETVDVLYSTGSGRDNKPVVVVEMKRGLIDFDFWVAKRRDKAKTDAKAQLRLSRELRGYAFKYECPQIICFDGKYLLMLQFRASKKEEINTDTCKIDCWIFPRENPNGTTLRSAFYRFLVQGFRRCQGLRGLSHIRLDNVRVKLGYFNGAPSCNEPLPEGWLRYLEVETGRFYWLRDGDMSTQVWETEKSWDPPEPAAHVEREMAPDEEMEDLYSI